MLKSVVYNLGTKVVGAILNFAIAILLSRYLGAEGKGSASLFLTYVTFIVVGSEFVGGSTLVYLVPRFKLSSLLWPSYLISATSALLVSYYTVRFNLLDGVSAVHLFLVGLFCSLFSIHQKVISAKQRFKWLNTVTFLQVLLLFVLLWYGLSGFIPAGVAVYHYALLFSYFAIVVYSGLLMYRIPSDDQLPAANVWYMVKLAFVNQVAHVLHLLATRYAFVAIAYSIGEAATGVYSNSTQIAEAVWILTNSFATIQYAKLANTTNDAQAAELTRKLGKLSLLLSVVALITANVLPAGFYTFVFGPEFNEIKHPLLLLSPGVLLFNFMLIYGHYFSAKGIYRYNTLAVVISTAVTALLFYLYRNQLSLTTAALINTVAYSLSGLLVYGWFVRKSGSSVWCFIPSIQEIKDFKNRLLPLD